MDFAKAHNFDPLIAENWYTVTNYDIIKFEVRKEQGEKGRDRGDNLFFLLTFSIAWTSSIEVLQTHRAYNSTYKPIS